MSLEFVRFLTNKILKLKSADSHHQFNALMQVSEQLKIELATLKKKLRTRTMTPQLTSSTCQFSNTASTSQSDVISPLDLGSSFLLTRVHSIFCVEFQLIITLPPFISKMYTGNM
jgi:hypothetical protein